MRVGPLRAPRGGPAAWGLRGTGAAPPGDSGGTGVTPVGEGTAPSALSPALGEVRPLPLPAPWGRAQAARPEVLPAGRAGLAARCLGRERE